MLEVIEAVEGPMESNLEIAALAPREKFGVKAEAVFDKALAQAKKVFDEDKNGRHSLKESNTDAAYSCGLNGRFDKLP